MSPRRRSSVTYKPDRRGISKAEDVLAGRGRVWYAGPRCSLISDWKTGEDIFFYNHSMTPRGIPPRKGMSVDFEAFFDRKYIRKHSLYTKWEASWVSEVGDLRRHLSKPTGQSQIDSTSSDQLEQYD